MSSSEATTQGTAKQPFHVRVTRRGAVSEDAHVTVYSGRDEVVAEATGEVSLQLPRGLYTVRVERAGSTSEKVYRHEGMTQIEIEEPLRVSAMPVFDTATTHEYYAYTSQEWSAKDTRPPFASGAPAQASGRLFIFLRALDAGSYRGEDLAKGLRLLDSQGGVLSTFTDGEVQRATDGWLALSARAEPGSYLLRFDGEPAREMPLYVYPHRSTQLFASFLGPRSRQGAGRLRLETAAILMPHVDESFDPDDRTAQAVDAALAGLQLGRNDMPAGAMRTLLEGKFENPMLGLLGAHLLLLEGNPHSDATAEVVVDNLDSLLPGAPDVRALRVILAGRRRVPPPPVPFDRPPMLRVAFEAVMLASARHPELVPDGGLLERASVRVLVDSPWSSWEPIFDVAAAAPPCIQETYAVTLSAASATEQPSPPESDWLGSYLRDAVRRTRSSKRSLDVHRLATQAGVPTRVLERRLSALDLPDPESLPADDLTQIHGIGETFERVLKDLGYRTYDQIATLDQDDLQRISQRLGRHAGRLVKDGWIGQAQKLSGGE